MIRELTTDVYQQVIAVGPEDAGEQRKIISKNLLIDEDMDVNYRRDIVIDSLFLALHFAQTKNLELAGAAALIEVIGDEFQQLMDPRYDLNRPVSQQMQEMRDLFDNKIASKGQSVDEQTWSLITDYFCDNVLPQREAYFYVFHQVPIVVDKTVALCIDTPLRVHLPLTS